MSISTNTDAVVSELNQRTLRGRGLWRLSAAVLCLALMLASGVQAATPAIPSHPHPAWLKAWRERNPIWRGIHLGLSSDRQAEQLDEELPKLAAAGVNVVIVEVDYNFDFQSHPELRPAHYVTKAGARELARKARECGIRLIPQLNCLGHQSWGGTTGELLAKHPDFDETPGQFPGNKGIYCRSWCPQIPDVDKVVFALIDELIDAFDADAFHVGMDEVFIIGSKYCPRCRGQDPAKLFAMQVNALHSHIVGQRHLEMLMWGDRFLSAKATGYGKWEASENHTEGAVDLAPKDIILCDWHYNKRAEYPSVPYLLKKGFRVWPSGWQPLEAAKAFSAFAHNLRTSENNPRLLGYLCTTWGKVRIPQAAEWRPLVEPLQVWK